MKDPLYNEIRNLMPRIRINMCAGRQLYRDQEREVNFEDPHWMRIQQIGSLRGAGSRMEAYAARDRNLRVTISLD
jgi:hypothetical protein